MQSRGRSTSGAQSSERAPPAYPRAAVRAGLGRGGRRLCPQVTNPRRIMAVHRNTGAPVAPSTSTCPSLRVCAEVVGVAAVPVELVLYTTAAALPSSAAGTTTSLLMGVRGARLLRGARVLWLQQREQLLHPVRHRCHKLSLVLCRTIIATSIINRL